MSKKIILNGGNMTQESHELFASVNYLKHKVEAIEKIELLNLRSNKTLRQEYAEILQSDDLLFRIYKEIDGKKSQKEIASAVGTTGFSVSIKIKELYGLGLIEVKEVISNKRIYKHTIAEEAFKLTRL